MNELPDGWPRIASSIYYDDPRAGIDWLCKAFGFEVRFLVEGPEGALMHSELVYGDGVVMVAGSGSRPFFKSPGQAGGGNTQSLMVMVDDVDAHYARAKHHGAEIFQEPMVSDYGEEYWTDRSYGAIDPGGHHFWFVQRIKTGNPRWSEVRNKVDKHG